MPANILISAMRAIRPKEYTAIVLSLLGIALLSNVNASHLNPDLFEGYQNQTSFSLLSSCSVEANAQESLTSFDVAVRDVKKTAVDFPSCFSTALLPVTVTTAFSPVVTAAANAVDSGEKNE